MDQRERYPDEAETMRLALEALQSRIWTALPCVVQAFPAASGLDPMMLDAQPLIAGSYLNSKGQTVTLQMPLLVDVPVQFPSGGGATLTFPIKKGDECLVTFSARCIDAWWQLGAGTGSSPGQVPPDARMHNLSDGIAHVGIRSKKRSFVVDPNFAQLRTDDGAAGISLNVTTGDIQLSTTKGNISVFATGAGKIVHVTAPGGINLNGVTIDSSGNVNAPGNVLSQGTVTGTVNVKNGAGTTLGTHNHGNSSSNPPVPGS